MNQPDVGRTRSLRLANAGAAVLHAVQAVAVLALSTDFALPVTASYLAGPPGTPPQDPVTLFDIPTGLAVAGFLALSAFAHVIVCTVWWPRYLADLGGQRNAARWLEYSFSASLMIVLIAQLVGISDVAALVGLFGVNAAMILFGWLQEHYEHPGNLAFSRRARYIGRHNRSSRKVAMTAPSCSSRLPIVGATWWASSCLRTWATRGTRSQDGAQVGGRGANRSCSW